MAETALSRDDNPVVLCGTCSCRAKSREIANRCLGDGCRARPDQEEESLAGPALGGLGAEETAAFACGEVSLGGPKTSALAWARIWLGDTASVSPRAQAMRADHVCCHDSHKTSTGSESSCLSADRLASSASAAPSLAQRQGRGFQSRGPDRAGLR